jgi:hypothetical protein
MRTLRKKVPGHIAVQGNLDPDLLYQPLEVIREETRALLDSMAGDAGFIVNLGHGLKPDMPVDAVRCLVDTVKEWSPSSDNLEKRSSLPSLPSNKALLSSERSGSIELAAAEK